jgi:lactate permease
MAVLILYLRLTGQNDTSHPQVEHTSMLRRFAHKEEEHGGEALMLSMEERIIPDYPMSQVLSAWLPYGLLVCCVLLWGWPPLQRLLNSATFLIRWPLLHDVVHRMPPITASPAPYHALYTVNWLAAAGTACMTATLLSAIVLRVSLTHFVKILFAVSQQLKLPVATITSVLGIAFLMNYSGATATLGLAFSATGVLFPFFSALLGWIGVFLTGSDTSSNALFGNLQVVTAEKLGFSPVLMAAANSAGGVVGKMISLQTIAVAAASTGLSEEKQARLFRFTLKHSILLIIVTGGIALAYAYLSHL